MGVYPRVLAVRTLKQMVLNIINIDNREMMIIQYRGTLCRQGSPRPSTIAAHAARSVQSFEVIK